MISFEDFSKVELRVGKIVTAERVPNSDKLLRLLVSLGDENRQIVAGIGKAYDPTTLVGREIVIVANLEPREIMGFQSHGMLLAASGETPVILIPEKDVPSGTAIH